ncbi:MAG: peptidylprolyl isomerase [Bdellovibrionales bacterium]|nr:peptidylprolyl isomerase [Bdellovibrionales bacterium]
MRSKLIPAILLTLALVAGLAGLAYTFRSGPTAEEKSADTSAEDDADASAEAAKVAAEPAPETNKSPDLSVDGDGLSRAVAQIRTARGNVRFKFYTKDAPKTVERIVQLINEGFYNGLTFHRVVPNFVIQGGDPQGNGTGGSGTRLKAEFNKRQHRAGAVAMARSADPDSADSQFYVTLSPQPHLDQQYTVFGQVIEGMDVVEKIRPGDAMSAVVIEPTAPEPPPSPTNETLDEGSPPPAAAAPPAAKPKR